jgi:ribosomal protein S18 acetylase RimI-like enzyme
MFELSYDAIGKDESCSWKAAFVPWDSETFGFNVAVLQARESPKNTSVEAMRGMIRSYAQARDISMIIASIPGKDKDLNLLLQSIDFVHVDIAISIQYLMSKFQARSYRIVLREANQKEAGEIADIAESAFANGRYHLDPKIPLSLANKRYKDWVLRTQIKGNKQQLLAAEIEGSLCGFMIHELKDREGYLHLAALMPQWRGKGLGVEIIDSSLNYLKSHGADIVKSKVPASNMGALNMHSALGTKFMDFEYLLHWHSF